MRTRSLILVAGLAIGSLVGTGTSAVAQPIDKGHFHDVFTDDPYSCDGLPAQDSGDISGNFVFNQRGSSPFPYYRESVHGTFVTTNLLTGGTFTQVQEAGVGKPILSRRGLFAFDRATGVVFPGFVANFDIDPDPVVDRAGRAVVLRGRQLRPTQWPPRRQARQA